MNAFRSPAAVLACLLLTLQATAQLSTVSGTISSADPNSRQAAGDVVVWLVPVSEEARKNTRSASPIRSKLIQKNKSFQPHLLVLPAGSSVEFPNRDQFFHNVFSLFNGKRFDLGLYEAGESREVHFDRVGISYIFCNIHPEMSAVVITLTTPHYSIIKGAGRFEVAGVAPGEYELHVFAEGLSGEQQKSLIRTVTVHNQVTSLGTLELPPRSLQARHKNLYGSDYDSTSGRPYEHHE